MHVTATINHQKNRFLSPGQTITTFQRNVSQHCWPSIWTQYIATLLGATCCTCLAALLRRVATCWVLKIELVRMSRCNIAARTWPNDYNIMKHPQILHEKFDHFQIWASNTQHVTACRSRVAKRAQHAGPNNNSILVVPAKRSQHFNAIYRNILGRNMLRAFDHPVAKCCDVLRHLGCRIIVGPSMLRAFGHPAATCCDMLGVIVSIWKWSDFSCNICGCFMKL